MFAGAERDRPVRRTVFEIQMLSPVLMHRWEKCEKVGPAGVFPINRTKTSHAPVELDQGPFQLLTLPSESNQTILVMNVPSTGG